MVLWNQQPITLAVFLNFYKKRIKRIFPAYYTMILLVLLFAFFFLTIRDYSLLKRDTIWAALFATNIHEYLQGLNHSAEVHSVICSINFCLATCICQHFRIYFKLKFPFTNLKISFVTLQKTQKNYLTDIQLRFFTAHLAISSWNTILFPCSSICAFFHNSVHWEGFMERNISGFHLLQRCDYWTVSALFTRQQNVAVHMRWNRFSFRLEMILLAGEQSRALL